LGLRSVFTVHEKHRSRGKNAFVSTACNSPSSLIPSHTLETYELADAKWMPLGIFRNDDTVSIAPFDQIVIHLLDFWR
jgi:hypothetical protein